MGSVVMLPSGRFRAFAQVRAMRDACVFDRRDDGERWSAATERRMRAGEWVKRTAEEPVPVPVQGLTIRRASELYHESEMWLAKAQRTRDSELDKIKPVLEALGDRQLETLTQEMVKKYLATRRLAKPKRTKDPDKKLSGTQCRLELAALSAVCNWAVDEKLVPLNVTRGIRRPKGDRRTARMSDEVLGALLDEADSLGVKYPAAYPFFYLLFTTVCRPAELAAAPKTWLRHDPPQICLPRTKNEDARNILLTVKNYELLQRHLDAQPAECPLLFGTRNRYDKEKWGPYNYAHPWRAMLSAAEAKLEVPLKGEVVPYLGRHEGISRLFERTDLSDGQIAGLSGHRSSQALWLYKHLRNEHQRPTMNALDQMVSDAVDRSISGLHPSRKLLPGEMLTPRPDKPPA